MLWRGKPWGLPLFCWLLGVACYSLAPLLLLMPSSSRASIYAVYSRKVSPLPLLDGLAVLVSSMPMLFPWMVRAILLSGCYCSLLCISVRICASMYSCAVGDATSPAFWLPPFVIFSLVTSRLRYTLFLLLHDYWLNSVIRFDAIVLDYLDVVSVALFMLAPQHWGFSAMLLRRLSIRLFPHSLTLTLNCLTPIYAHTMLWWVERYTVFLCHNKFLCQTYFALSVAALLIFPLQR